MHRSHSLHHLSTTGTLTIGSLHHDRVAHCKQEEELSHFWLFARVDLLNKIMVIKYKLVISICIPAKINLLQETGRNRKQ